MGNRRMGARRLSALLGQKLAEANTNTSGPGSTPFVVSNIISRRGTEVVTEVTVDLGSSAGVATQPGTVDLIIGLSSSTDGVQSGGNAYLTQLTPSVNGYIYGVEMICTEQPTAGMRDIDLRAGTTAALAFSGTVGASPKALIVPGAAWTVGGYQATGSLKADEALLDTGLDDYYLYLTKGSSTDGVEVTGTQGKFTIRVLGILATEDK